MTASRFADIIQQRASYDSKCQPNISTSHSFRHPDSGVFLFLVLFFRFSACALGILNPTPTQLHYNALCTAAGALAWIIDFHLALGSACARRAATGRGSRHFFVVPADLAHKIVKGVLNINTRLGRGFDKFAAKLPCEGLTLC